MDLQVFVKTEMELKIMAAQIEIALVKKLENEEKNDIGKYKTCKWLEREREKKEVSVTLYYLDVEKG